MNTVEDQSSNSLLSLKHFAPLLKKQPTERKYQERKRQKNRDMVHQLISSVYILSGLQFKPIAFRKALLTYGYERRLDALITYVQNSNSIEIEISQFLLTLSSLFRQFQSSPANKFNIILHNNGGMLYFTHRAGKLNRTALLIVGITSNFQAMLKEADIDYECLETDKLERQKLIISGRNISLFYGILANWFISKRVSLEIVANFSFQHCRQNCPLTVYNGREYRKQYLELASTRRNILQEDIPILYGLKLQGLWHGEQMTKLQTCITDLECEAGGPKHGYKHELHYFPFKYSTSVQANVFDESDDGPIESSRDTE